MNNTQEYLLKLIQKRNKRDLAFKTVINNYKILVNENINLEKVNNNLNKMNSDIKCGWFFDPTTIIEDYY